MNNEDKIAKIRHHLAGDRLLIVADDFDAQHPLDTVVKTSGGKASYGYIPEELASKLGTKPAPVIVTEELFDHLDVKETRIKTVADRGFDDMRDAVEYALQKPQTLALGGGDGSFNIFFKKEGFEKGLMYANLMYSNEPVPAYIVRSISPTGKVKEMYCLKVKVFHLWRQKMIKLLKKKLNLLPVGVLQEQHGIKEML